MKPSDFSQFLNFDFMKNFPQSTSMPFDLESLMESQRKNMEALAQANQSATKNIQTTAQQQNALMVKIAEAQSNMAREMLSEGTPEQKIARQTEILKNTYESSISGLQELANMIEKSNMQTADIINKRISASLNEIQESVTKKTKKAA
ncbi:MAG: TIGR01841 family phasin [Rhodospirillales bacterium]|nr:TIGR01841 family phasin [Rhodospirillales bacterium]